jgi:hypothetical protein
VRVGLAIAVLLALAGCSSGEKKAAQTDAKAGSPVERCTQRILARIGGDAKIRSYVERTYCEPFARKGWVYADGTLSIGAQLSTLNGGACAAGSSKAGGSTTTIPCDARPLYPLDCAVLQYVRRNEVRTYLHKLERSHSVSCDDGTPLGKLGAG